MTKPVVIITTKPAESFADLAVGRAVKLTRGAEGARDFWGEVVLYHVEAGMSFVVVEWRAIVDGRWVRWTSSFRDASKLSIEVLS